MISNKRNPQCAFTIEEELELVNLYKNGKTSGELSKMVEVANYTIIRILSNYITLRNPKEAQNVKFNLFTIFFNKFTKQKNGCWEWNCNKKEYGDVYYKTKHYSSHRFSYTLFKEQIPEGLFVLHKCDNPCCVNPDHLFLGTQQDNITDMWDKGRGITPTYNRD